MIPPTALCRIVSHDTITACKNSTLDAVFNCVTEGPAQVQSRGEKTVSTLGVFRSYVILCHVLSVTQLAHIKTVC